MPKELSMDIKAYDREYDAFIKQLEDFHQQRGSTFRRLPQINGKVIDLYLLYVVVTARGGWQKVNNRNEWEEIIEDFRIPASCVNSITALKHIYIRYLDAYERVNYLGEYGDDRSNDPDEEESRSMRQRRAVRAVNIVPLAYNHQQHAVQKSSRQGLGMSADIYQPSVYDKLALSLSCPLPNEHDFAFNLCTLLSNEGKHTLQLARCPRLLDFMLAHTGVFKDQETLKYFISNYKDTRGKSLIQFWKDSVNDEAVIELLHPEIFDSKFDPEKDGLWRLGPSAKIKKRPPTVSTVITSSTDADRGTQPVPTLESSSYPDSDRTGVPDPLVEAPSSDSPLSAAKEPPRVDTGEPGSSHGPPDPGQSVGLEGSADSRNLDGRGHDDSCSSIEEALGCDTGDLRLDREEDEMLHLGRDLGLLDAEGSRISQVLHVLRNLSFEESNVASMARSETCLRFLVLCVCSRWGGLSVGALDTLGNIASEITLKDPVVDSTSSLLVTTVCQGASSQDRAVVLRSLEVLNRLAQSDPNETILNGNVDQTVYDQICRFLTIHDIMLLIYTLEALYSLSSMGATSCNCIVRAKGSIHTLVSLLTVEAQSYGPDACIGMKVVETVTGVVSDSSETSSPVSASNAAGPGPPPAPVVAPTPSAGAVPPPVAAPVTTVAPTTVLPSIHTIHSSTPVLAAAAAASPSVSHSPAVPKIMPKPIDMAKRVVPAEVEEFVTSWVLKNYESCPTNAIEQAIVYRHFAASMHALGRKQGLNPVLLSNCVRKVFGTGVGPCRRQVEDGTEKWHYNAIKRRDGVVLPAVAADKTAPSVVAASPNLAPTPIVVAPKPANDNSGSILKAQLSAPLRNPPSPIKVIGGSSTSTASPTIRSIIQSPNSGGNAQAIPRTDNSSLIKSLLANKITRAIPKTEAASPGHLQNPAPTDAQNQPLANAVGTVRLPSFNGLGNELSRGDSNASDMSDSKKLTSFEGILQNGVKEDESATPHSKKPAAGEKNLLADLLEKTVGGDVLNGVINKDLKIADKIILPSMNQTGNHPVYAKVNGPVVTTNGRPDGFQINAKRPLTPDSQSIPVKRLAVEDNRPGSEGKVMYVVSQNGSEVTKTMQPVFHQQTQQLQTVPANQVSAPSQTVITTNQGQQMIIQRPQSSVINSQPVQQHSISQRISSPQVLSTPNSIQTSAGNGQIISSQPVATNVSTNAHSGQVVQQVIAHGQGGQKVILHGTQLGQMLTGQMILPQNSGQNIIVQGPGNVPGQVIVQGVNSTSSSQNPVIVHGANGQSQVLVSTNNTQSPVIIQGNNPAQGGQIVMSGVNHGQAVVNTGGQAMILAGTHGQVMMGGQTGQHVVVSGTAQNQGQVLLPGGGVGNAVFLSPQTTTGQGSQKTLIILPNTKMVVSSQSQQQSNPVMLQRQVVQVVASTPSATQSTPVRTIRTTTHPSETHSSTGIHHHRPTVQAVQSPEQPVSNNAASHAPASNVISVQVTTGSASGIGPAPTGPRATLVSQTNSASSSAPVPHIPAPQVLASGVVRRPSSTGLRYLCEWRGCHQVFASPGQVYHHVCKVHCPPHIPELTCQWAGCDAMVRKRFSTMTHVHDRHCNEQLLQVLALRRQQIATCGKTDIPMPQTPPHHPGYAPNAAYHAIKRHSLEVINQRDAVEKEGPVTKSIRLTAALVLRNLVIYSTSGKALLKGYEAELSNVAISQLESSRTVSQILYDIHSGESSTSPA